MFSTWHSRTHSARKRFISHIYSKSVIHDSPAFARQAQVILYERLLPMLASLALKPLSERKRGVDVHEIWNASTMDFITCYLFGLKNGSNFLKDQEYRRHWLHLYHGRKTYTFFAQELPRLTKFLKKFYIPLVPVWVDNANRELEDWTQQRCDETMEYLETDADSDKEVGNSPVVLSALLAGIKKEETTKGDESVLKETTLTNQRLSVASEMIDHLAAGHETSGITLTYISWHLSKNLALQGELRAELHGLSPRMILPQNRKAKFGRLPDPKELDTLPILHAVLMETLRLHAAIPGNQPRMTPHPESRICGYKIPGGVRIGAQAHSLHRNAEVFAEPEVFDHTRWLDDKSDCTEAIIEWRKERDRWFWAFSSGGRMCVGSNFAMYGMLFLCNPFRLS